jgi:AcrR family transcriptional regulator
MGGVDRRANLKALHRRAILDAASTYLDAHGAAGLRVDDIARHAGVSRRSVFNHFDSVDDLILTVVCEALASQIDAAYEHAVVRPADGGVEGAFDELAQVVQAIDLPGSMSGLYAVFGDPDVPADSRRDAMVAQTTSRVVDHLTSRTIARHPEVDNFDTELMVSAFISGVAVIVRHWVYRTDRTTADALVTWDRLLDDLALDVRTALVVRSRREATAVPGSGSVAM